GAGQPDLRRALRGSSPRRRERYAEPVLLAGCDETDERLGRADRRKGGQGRAARAVRRVGALTAIGVLTVQIDAPRLAGERAAPCGARIRLGVRRGRTERGTGAVVRHSVAVVVEPVAGLQRGRASGTRLGEASHASLDRSRALAD